MASTKEQIVELERAWNDNGQCNSCGWHSSFSEVWDFIEGFSLDEIDKNGAFWIPCTSKDDPDNNHRGCYIYPNLELFKEYHDTHR